MPPSTMRSAPSPRSANRRSRGFHGSLPQRTRRHTKTYSSTDCTARRSRIQQYTTPGPHGGGPGVAFSKNSRRHAGRRNSAFLSAIPPPAEVTPATLRPGSYVKIENLFAPSRRSSVAAATVNCRPSCRLGGESIENPQPRGPRRWKILSVAEIALAGENQNRLAAVA